MSDPRTVIRLRSQSALYSAKAHVSRLCLLPPKYAPTHPLSGLYAWDEGDGSLKIVAYIHYQHLLPLVEGKIPVRQVRAVDQHCDGAQAAEGFHLEQLAVPQWHATLGSYVTRMCGSPFRHQPDALPCSWLMGCLT